MVNSEWAARHPIETIISGPAASAVGAAHLTGYQDALVVDVGGTTTDIAFIDEREDDTWDELVQTVCLYQQDEVPIFVASPRFIHAFPLANALVEDSVDVELRRATRIHTLVRAGAIPVAVPGGAFGRDGLVYPFGTTEDPIFAASAFAVAAKIGSSVVPKG